MVVDAFMESWDRCLLSRKPSKQDSEDVGIAWVREGKGGVIRGSYWLDRVMIWLFLHVVNFFATARSLFAAC